MPMDYRRVVVIEVNEVPRRVLTDVAAMGRAPFIGQLLDDDQVVDTVVSEQLPREMYPSQTWASLNTGVPWRDHRVWWYGDPKPAAYPLYWQVAARSDRSVGLVSTLHSSPLSVQCSTGDYRFAIPDCFAVDADTRPDRYRRFQELNLRLTRANSRKSDFRSARSEVGPALKAMAGLGLSGATVARLGRLAAEAAAGRVPRERVRSGQFLILSDVFLRLLTDEAPDLAVMFTNHVAAAMHRYWYALYPDDFSTEHYPIDWVARHRDEIPVAVEMLDRFLMRLDEWCKRNDRTLVVVSSMGQGPSRDLESDQTHDVVIVNPEAFLAAVGVDLDRMPLVRGSMAPNLTLACGSTEAAEQLEARLAEVGGDHHRWRVDRVDDVVTLTYGLVVVDDETVILDGRSVDAATAGLEIHAVDDHSSGRHIPEGVVAVSNSPSFKQPADRQVDYLDFAPAMLDLLGVARPDHHKVPVLQL
ncbi:MAG: hypothetical protein OEZ14_09500 [Acidimicrobiia bacterium]|nr:hypothetical protein [Acidimicrobiia bacterium]MDH5520753.1 hypothetical protein [Acidimicrobiia bacterium]